MGNETSIEWTAGKDGKPGATWNPWWGCNEIAPECGTHGGGSGLCYAAAFASRGLHPAHRGNAVGGQWTGALTISGEGVWKAPFKLLAGTSVFTCSMSDFWHEDVPLPWLDRALAVIDDTPLLRYLILTKRPGNINRKLDALKRRWPTNAWCGASVGHIKSLPLLKPLRRIDAPIRFLSCEPLLTPLVPGLDLDSIGWVIVGGQSGAGAQDMPEEWAQAILDLCGSAGVPAFMKQMAKKAPIPAHLMVRQMPA